MEYSLCHVDAQADRVTTHLMNSDHHPIQSKKKNRLLVADDLVNSTAQNLGHNASKSNAHLNTWLVVVETRTSTEKANSSFWLSDNNGTDVVCQCALILRNSER